MSKRIKREEETWGKRGKKVCSQQQENPEGTTTMKV